MLIKLLLILRPLTGRNAKPDTLKKENRYFAGRHKFLAGVIEIEATQGF